MRSLINSIVGQLNTMTQAANDKPNVWGVKLFATAHSWHLREIQRAARDLCEALDAAIEGAEEKERLRDRGPKGGAA
jgi:hypothetical protein